MVLGAEITLRVGPVRSMTSVFVHGLGSGPTDFG